MIIAKRTLALAEASGPIVGHVQDGGSGGLSFHEVFEGIGRHEAPFIERLADDRQVGRVDGLARLIGP